ncbi:hypothetical protein [Halomonas sp. 328]|nr:hypothetical protein [Halomonas sp. 328]
MSTTMTLLQAINHALMACVRRHPEAYPKRAPDVTADQGGA